MNKMFPMAICRGLVYLMILGIHLLFPSQNLLAQNVFVQQERECLEQTAINTDDSSERLEAYAYLTIYCLYEKDCLANHENDYFEKLKAASSSMPELGNHYLKIAEALLLYYRKENLDNAGSRDSVLTRLDEAYEHCVAIQNSVFIKLIYKEIQSISFKYDLIEKNVEILQKYILSFESWNEVSDAEKQDAYFELGQNYAVMGLGQLVDEYFTKTYEIGANSSSLKISTMSIVALQELGVFNNDTLKMQEAIGRYKEIDTSGLDFGYKINIMMGLTRLHNYTGQTKKALVYQKEYEALKSQANMEISYYDKADLLRLLTEAKEYDEFEKRAAELLAELDTAEFASRVLNIYGLLLEGYSPQKKYKAYHDISQKYFALKEKIDKESLVEKLAESEKKFESKLKTIQIDLLEVEKESMLKQRRLLTIGIILVAVFLAVVFWLLYRLRKQHALTLQEKEQTELKSKKLQELEESKNNFFINASHELRTPLTLIDGPVNRLLEHEPLSAEGRSMMEMVAEQSKGMKEQLDQILLLDKGDQFNSATINKEIVDMGAFLKDLLDSFVSMAQNKGIKFTIEQDISDLKMEIDLLRVKTVVKNLLANALKFTPKGGNIGFCASHKDSRLTFQVSDSGRGIPAASLPHVFDRFYQVPSKVQEGGTGIGLAICKRYVEQMGGDISVESPAQTGTTFFVEIPSRVVGRVETEREIPSLTPSLQKREGARVSDTNDTRPLILIVEDHAQMADYLELILQEEFRVQKAIHGKEALEYLERGEIPQLIVSDVMMPEMDGWTLIQELRGHDSWKNIPVIILTAKNKIEDKIAFLRAGVDDYLVKPFLEEELIVRIDNLLENYQNRAVFLEEEKTQQEQEQEQEENTLNTYDQEWINKFKVLVEPMLGEFDLTIEKVAEEVSLSAGHFHRKLKLLTGMTAMQFIKYLRFEKARELLESNPEIPIKVVSYSVGFKSTKNFSRNFKKRYGVYPSAYHGEKKKS